MFHVFRDWVNHVYGNLLIYYISGLHSVDVDSIIISENMNSSVIGMTDMFNTFDVIAKIVVIDTLIDTIKKNELWVFFNCYQRITEKKWFLRSAKIYLDRRRQLLLNSTVSNVLIFKKRLFES